MRAYWTVTKNSARRLWRDREARPFLLYNVLRVVTVVWITLYLSWVHSLAMKACVYWLYFELFSNFIALCSVLMAKQKTSTHAYSYGLDRSEILLGFSNAAFEVCTCGVVVMYVCVCVCGGGGGVLCSVWDYTVLVGYSV
jgi:Co/Zn/Cd efflux system component